jgi:hypothetical protein
MVEAVFYEKDWLRQVETAFRLFCTAMQVWVEYLMQIQAAFWLWEELEHLSAFEEVEVGAQKVVV